MNVRSEGAQRSGLPARARMDDVRKDVVLAVALADQGRAHGDLVAALRRRLCGYVRGLASEAREFAAGRPTASERTGYARTVREALHVADTCGRSGPDAANSLRKLARSVDAVARMAAYGRRASRQQKPSA